MKSSCQKCGAEIPSSAPGNSCPACLLEEGKSSGTTVPGAPPLELEALQKLFPQLEIHEFIGSGGMGGVYRARQPQLERDVALKVVTIGDQPERHERFLREGKALAQLNHSNIVQVHDSGVVEGFGYFVMEYVDGQSLQTILHEESIPTEEAEDIIRQVCEALQFAHDRGITHRDIKPGNILIGADGSVKIADFGLAKALQTQPSGFQLTLSQEQVGTPYYMAPEQRTPGDPADHRADLYALGVVFYEMLTKRLPIGRVDKPSVYCPVDPRMDDLILTAMDADPNKRPKSAQEFRQRLEEISLAPNKRRTGKEIHARSTVQGAKRTGWGRVAFFTLGGTTLLGLLLGGLACLLFPKMSQAAVTLKVSSQKAWDVQNRPQERLWSEKTMARVSKALELPLLWNCSESSALNRLQKHTDILFEPDSDRFRIGFKDRRYDHAAAVANQWAKTAVEVESGLYRAHATLQISLPAKNWNIFQGDPNRPHVPTAYDTFVEGILERGALAEAVEMLELESDSSLKSGLVASHVRGTDLVRLDFWGKELNEAARIVNAVAQAIVSFAEKDEANRTVAALDTLEGQLKDQENKMEAARLRMLNLADRYRIMDIEALQERIPQSRLDHWTIFDPPNGTPQAMKHQSANAKLALLQSKEGDDRFAAAVDGGADTSLLIGWTEYNMQIKEHDRLLASGLGDDHPDVKKIVEKIEGLRKGLELETANYEKALQTQLSEESAKTAEDSMDERRKFAEYSEASKEYELQKNMLSNMQAKFDREQVDLQVVKVHETAETPLTSASLPIEKLGWASPAGTSGPDPGWLLGGMTGIGFALGLLLIYPILLLLERRRS